jgi:predicted nucleic acid-binding Zn ribbon protein
MADRAGGPVPLGEVLEGLLSTKGLGAKLRQGMAVAVWPEVVGDKLARVTTATTCKGGRLYVDVKSSVWMQELAFLQSELVDKVNRRIGRQTVRRLVLRLKGVSGGW